MPKGKRLDGTACERLARSAQRAKPLIVRVFGAAIAPRGRTAWLGGPIGLLAPFGGPERARPARESAAE